jgi:hypothetical protein
MMTHKEQEDKVYKEFLTVKDSFERILNKKINRSNFIEAIIEVTKIATQEASGENPNIQDSDRDVINKFFTNCQQYLADVIWRNTNRNCLNINISYKNESLSTWNMPIDMFFENKDVYALVMTMMVKSLNECLMAYFIMPQMRQAVMDGDEMAIKALYDSFNRPSMESSLANLKLLKENFPDFYEHITTSLDVMKLEEMQKFFKNKNEPRKSNKTRQRKKKAVSRVKGI